MKFRDPYFGIALKLTIWEQAANGLKKSAELKGEYKAEYKHYQETLEKIFAVLVLLSKETSVTASISLLHQIKAINNSFTTTKGRKGCPLVVHKENVYEVIFAKYYTYYMKEIFTDLPEAVKDDKALSSLSLFAVNKILNSTQKSIASNISFVNASLPKEEKRKPCTVLR
jgi:hypothetical protein